jgi:hypothetical protein
VERILVDYFADMFTSSDPLEVEKTCEVVAGKLNDDQVSWCSQPFSREEVEEAIFQMHPLKAPGPDGLPALFYHKYWNIIQKFVSWFWTFLTTLHPQNQLTILLLF